MRKVDKEKRSACIVKKIFAGKTWDELEQEYMLTRTYMQVCLKQYIKSERQYELILARARANSKTDVIYIAETGVLLNNYGFLRGKNRVFVPEFCRNEIKKIEPGNTNVLRNPKICWSNISWIHIKNLPTREVKPRAIGVAAFCCAMAKRNNNSRIIVYTSSRDIADLVELQQMNNLKVIKF